MDRSENYFGVLKEFLINHIDPDSGLLEEESIKRILRRRDIADIEAKDTFHKRNSLLLDLIAEKEAMSELCLALKETRQIHVVNYLESNGEYRPEFKDVWPLRPEQELLILEINQKALYNILNTTKLITSLVHEKILNKQQQENIFSNKTAYRKNMAFLLYLKRFSQEDYRKTIKCLFQSKQPHIAKLLETGGVVVCIDGQHFGSDVKVGVIKTPSYISLELMRLYFKAPIIFIDAKRKKGRINIAFMAYCSTLTELTELREIIGKGKFGKAIAKVLELPRDIDVKVSLSKEEYNRCRSYFSSRQDLNESTTVLDALSLDLLDIILQKSYIRSVLKESNGDVLAIKQLASVNFCWFQRITRGKFKKTIWNHMYRFCSKNFRKFGMSLIYRNNSRLLEHTIDLQNAVKTLRSADYLSDLQMALLRRKRFKKGGKKISKYRVTDLLEVVKFINEKKFDALLLCLCPPEQKLMAGVAENGGVSLKIELKVIDPCRSIESKKDFVTLLNILKHTTQFEVDDINILNAVEDRDIVAWIWCKSSIVLEVIKQQKESNNSLHIFSKLFKENLSAFIPEHINIDSSEFLKDFVAFVMATR